MTRSTKKKSAMGHLFIECQAAIQGEINKFNLDNFRQDLTENERLPIEGLNGKRINDRFAEIATFYTKSALRDICIEHKDVSRFTQAQWRAELVKRVIEYISDEKEDIGVDVDKLDSIVKDFISIYIGTQQFKKDLKLISN